MKGIVDVLNPTKNDKNNTKNDEENVEQQNRTK